MQVRYFETNVFEGMLVEKKEDAGTYLYQEFWEELFSATTPSEACRFLSFEHLFPGWPI
jgi:hypothetical protein